MHTILVILGGVVLFMVLALVARTVTWLQQHLLTTFALLWFIAAATNMAVGMVHAGYSFMAELPIFFVVFLVPVVLAWMTTQKRRR
ncbi:hypothetical protein [uncultured Alcanivorax sp.]|jgi:hypothetical protein|uniref:hypothetical protein n=1 Tax=uncultured Alcanivorax sp. TaxID=191215 RepID=UPI0030D77CAD